MKLLLVLVFISLTVTAEARKRSTFDQDGNETTTFYSKGHSETFNPDGATTWQQGNNTVVMPNPLDNFNANSQYNGPSAQDYGVSPE